MGITVDVAVAVEKLVGGSTVGGAAICRTEIADETVCLILVAAHLDEASEGELAEGTLERGVGVPSLSGFGGHLCG